MTRARSYLRLALRWANIVRGKSYYHLPQPRGRLFAPGELAGYFNDLTGKTEWPGPTDDAGLPLNRSPEGELYHFPMSVFQKALGHWDRWLLSERREDAHLAAVRSAADWACTALDERGCWDCWTRYGLPTKTPYSAMAQGQGLSLLVRAREAMAAPRYEEAALRALSPLLEETPETGVCRRVESGLVLEEYPYERPRTVLNGWIFALFGLYDLELRQPSPRLETALSDTLSALVAQLPAFDAGYWSYYDSAGKLASPSYHDLHIVQLRALADSFPDRRGPLEETADRFEKQFRSPANKYRTIAMKALQKLRDPGMPIH